MPELLHSFIYRPYVTLFLLGFLALSWLEQGRLRTAIWLISGYCIALAAEWGSINYGIPFGFYTYHYDALANDAVVAGVPVFDTLSFAFLSYVSFSFGQFFLSPVWRRGFDFQRVTARNVRNSGAALFLGAFFMTILDTITDPVAHLGRHWFLGDIYHYPEPGPHFDVTLANYAGWFVVGWAIIFVNQRADTLLARRELLRDKPVRLPHAPAKGLFAPVFWFGIAAFVLGVTAWLGWGYDLSGVPAADREAFVAETRKLFFAGSFIIAPIGVLAWVHAVRRGNQPSREQLTAWLADYPNAKFPEK
jgi:putative membrane protein